MSDPFDWCAEAARLRARITELAEGAGVQQARFGDEEVRYHNPRIQELRTQLAYAERRCAEQSGGKRKRFAKAARARPY